ncbi:MAG: PH domain-containing protein [Nostocoides sp.]
MGFPENVLARDEQVVKELHPHWLTVVVPALVGLVIASAVIAAVVLTPDTGNWNILQAVVLAAGLILLVWSVLVPFLRWRTTHYVITSHRVMVRRGILTKSGKDIALTKITDVGFTQTLLDRLIGAGSLRIESAGDSPDEELKDIPDSDDVQQLINHLIEEDDLRRRTRGASGTPDGT